MRYSSPLVAEVREAVSVHKQSVLKFVVEQFNMKRPIEGNVREDYQLKITNSFVVLENLKVDSMEINRAWENIRDSKRLKITRAKFSTYLFSIYLFYLHSLVHSG